jgi:hypothetical protein
MTKAHITLPQEFKLEISIDKIPDFIKEHKRFTNLIEAELAKSFIRECNERGLIVIIDED